MGLSRIGLSAVSAGFTFIKTLGHFDDCTKQVLKGPEDDDSDTDEEVKATQIVKFDSHC